MWLFKKRRDFIQMIAAQTKKVEEGMKYLCNFMETPNLECGQRVRDCEGEADEERRILVDELNRSFSTPIDREDIFSLSRAIDDIIDYAKSTVEEMLLFEIETNPHLKKMAESLYQGSRDISSAVLELKSHPAIAQEHMVRAKKTENLVEHIYREALLELFKKTDIISILKTREIYRHLSNAADRTDEVANIIGNVLVKFS